MDKNTIWAIVLSTIVIIGSYLILPVFFPSMAPVQNTQVAEEKIEIENDEINEIADLNTESLAISETTEETEEDESITSEEKFVITTNIAEIILTNKGGDILSYKLLDHKDTDTNDWIQISDNVSKYNRTCALAFGGADTNIIDSIFSVEKIDDKTILFKKNFNLKGSKYTLGKKYTFKDDENVFKLDVMIHNEEGKALDYDGIAYTLRTSPQIGPHYDPKQNRYETRQFVTYGQKYKREMLSSGQFKKWEKDFQWCGIAGKYFVELVIPAQTEIIKDAWYSSKVEVNNYANAQAFVERRALSDKNVTDTYYMYFGPRNEKDLKKYNVTDQNGWGIGGRKVSECLQTSGWLSWLEKILKFCLELLHKIVNNWGIDIIIMTIILKVIMFPMMKKQSLSSLKMQEVQPRIQALQKKYANDQQKLQQETTKLYQETGYNPASGCLPIVFQFLVVIAMYNLFNNYFEFRGAMFIPKWIPDLSTGDSVITFKKNLPLIGNHFRILPIIYVGTQLLSGIITNKSQPQQPGQSAATMKFMTYGMPLMFFFVFYNAPAGLLLYWLTSNILGIFQQLIINKSTKAKREEMAQKNSKTAVTQKTLPPKNKRK